MTALSSHKVLPGETLSSIARRHGTTILDLQRLNNISDPNRIAAGAVLQLPRARPFTAPPPPKAVPAGPSKSAPAASGWQDEVLHQIEGVWYKVERLAHTLAHEMLNHMREHESAQAAESKGNVPLVKRPPQAPAAPQSTPPSACASQTHTHRDEVLCKLKERLEVEPHVIVTNGVKLTRNERKQIIAAVGLCEIDKDVFGARNSDMEFIGRHLKHRGIPTSYSGVVHIGLSYGYIQFTQDSGNLGKLLRRMQQRDRKAFNDIFTEGEVKNASFAQTLLDLTNRPGPTGQQLLSKLSADERGRLIHLARHDADGDGRGDLPMTEEIRSARVQPISPGPGMASKDLWQSPWTERFKEAGDIPVFQDVQLDMAVEDFLNPILGRCREHKIRSAIGIAFVTACAVRGAKRSLIVDVAKALGKPVPFQTSADEIAALRAIAAAEAGTYTNAKGKTLKGYCVGTVGFALEEKKRAGVLLKDEWKFLGEDYYDPATFTPEHDH